MSPTPRRGIGLTDAELPHELLLRIASFLGSLDLCRLACVARRFAHVQPSIDLPAARRGKRLSVVEQAARIWLEATSDLLQEILVPQRTNRWLELMWAAEKLCAPLAFDLTSDHVTLSARGTTMSVPSGGTNYLVAASSIVMGPSGRYFAEFTVLDGEAMYFGVMRPGWPIRGDGFHSYPFTVHEHCFFDTTDGGAYPYDIGWSGMEQANEGDRIGMLLDLDQGGTMTVYKNGRRLGVMVEKGLAGKYCWAASLWRGAVRISSAM